jgi:hypothetical protein
LRLEAKIGLGAPPKGNFLGAVTLKSWKWCGPELYYAFVQAAQASMEPSPGRLARYLTRACWVIYAAAAAVCILAPEGRIFLGSLGMGVYWLLIVRFRYPLQRLADRAIRSHSLRFFAIGILSSDVVMENLAINFKGDLQSNLLLNSLLWLGAYLGSIAGWWFVARIFRLSPNQVFFIAGLLGVIIEQNWMIPKLLVSGQWGVALLSTPIVLVVYGAAVAPAFLLAGNPPNGGGRKAGVVGFAVALVLPALLFYALGALWIALLRPIVGS